MSTGMGASFHAEMWPNIAPAGAKLRQPLIGP